MHAVFRQWLLRINASYWFIPAVMTVAALLFSVLTYAIDVRLGQGWVGNIGWLHTSKPDGARSLLSSISGGMLGVAGTVFSITIAAVVYASGNYGPRLLTNFMTDRGNQVSLGTFIATFVYALMTLRTIRQPDEGGGVGFVPELSLMIAIVLLLLSVGVLVYFLHHVPDSIRINNVVAGVGNRALREIEKRYPDTFSGDRAGERPTVDGRRIEAKRIGYVQVVDFDTLRDLARETGATIRLGVRSGDFVHPGIALATVEIRDCADEDLRAAFAIGDDRTSSQDIEYSIDELVEIALRALSPGINDPFTAITCFHWLGAATTAVAMRNLDRDPDGHVYGEDGVYAIGDDFAHFVARGFGSVRGAAATSELAGRILIEAIEATAMATPDARRRAQLFAEADRLVEQARLALEGPALVSVVSRRDEMRELVG